jgi:hypothetical protein
VRKSNLGSAIGDGSEDAPYEAHLQRAHDSLLAELQSSFTNTADKILIATADWVDQLEPGQLSLKVNDLLVLDEEISADWYPILAICSYFLYFATKQTKSSLFLTIPTYAIEIVSSKPSYCENLRYNGHRVRLTGQNPPTSVALTTQDFYRGTNHTSHNYLTHLNFLLRTYRFARILNLYFLICQLPSIYISIRKTFEFVFL